MADLEQDADLTHPGAVAAAQLTDRLTKAVSAMASLAEQSEKWLDSVKEDGTFRPADMAHALFLIKELYEQLDRETKRIYHVKDAIEKHFLPKKLEDAGTDIVRVPGLGRSFSIRDMLSASFLDKEAGFEWLESIGQGDIIQRTVNAGTLASFVRNMILEEGIDPPAEVVKVSTYKSIGITKYTPRKTVKLNG